MTARVLAACALVMCLATPVAAGDATPWRGKIYEIVDGDSLNVVRGKRRVMNVRLWGIDAPEHGQPWGREATERLKRYEGKKLLFEIADTDRHNRHIVKIYLPGGELLQEALAREGYAWWWQRYAPKAWGIARAMLEAVEAKRGLWADPKPVPPWQWRRAK